MQLWNIIRWKYKRSWYFFKISITTFVKSLVEIVFLRWNEGIIIIVIVIVIIIIIVVFFIPYFTAV